MISVEKLKLVLPESLVFEMQGTFERFEINTEQRVSHFLSQVKHESGNYTKTEENLNYKDPYRLASIFKVDFDTNKDKTISDAEVEFAKAYVGKPEKIANYVYANQNGNGDEASGDGWLFKGRGYLMTTGRSNYKKLSDAMNDPSILYHPELLATPKYACLSAGYFWDSNKLNALADKGADDATVLAITKKVNGGTHGLSERQTYFYEIYNKLK